jgi:hypothetical protein
VQLIPGQHSERFDQVAVRRPGVVV